MPKIRNITILLLVSGIISAQTTTRPNYFDHAYLQHNRSEVTITASDSIPLLQAIHALRLEYGWQVNWESAPGYSRYDVVDDTDPKWRAAHPAEKGVTRPAGGRFSVTIPEPNELNPAASERDILTRLIEQYNATENPGRYVLRAGTDEQVTVVGTQVRDETSAFQTISPLLDAPITLLKARRSVEVTINSILNALQSATKPASNIC